MRSGQAVDGCNKLAPGFCVCVCVCVCLRFHSHSSHGWCCRKASSGGAALCGSLSLDSASILLLVATVFFHCQKDVADSDGEPAQRGGGSNVSNEAKC